MLFSLNKKASKWVSFYQKETTMVEKRKNGSKPLSIYWFVILVIVAGGVAYMAAVFYSAPYDIREVEANLIENKLIDCLIVDNYFKQEVLDNNFFDNCKINFETENYADWNLNQYYVEVNVLDFNTGKEIENGKSTKGNLNLKDYCEISKDKKGEKLPYCLKDSVYAISSGSNQGKYQLNFIVVVDKHEKNA